MIDRGTYARPVPDPYKQRTAECRSTLLCLFRSLEECWEGLHVLDNIMCRTTGVWPNPSFLSSAPGTLSAMHLRNCNRLRLVHSGSSRCHNHSCTTCLQVLLVVVGTSSPRVTESCQTAPKSAIIHMHVLSQEDSNGMEKNARIKADNRRSSPTRAACHPNDTCTTIRPLAHKRR